MISLGIIPARSGSERLPGKNTIDLGGKPLIAWSIIAAQESAMFDRLVVSTDDHGVAAVAAKYGCEVLDLKLVGPYSLVRENNNKPTHWVLVAFAAHIDPRQVRINEPEKIDEIGWFELDNLPSPLHSGVKYYLPNVKEYIIPS